MAACQTSAPAASTEDLQRSSSLKPDTQLSSADIGHHVQAMLERLLEPIVEELKNRLEMPPQELFSIRQAAALTGLSYKHIRRAVKKGELSCSNLGGDKRPTLRIARRDIDAWVEANRLKQAPAKAARDALVDHYFGKKKQKAAA